MAAATDYFTKVGNPGTATTLASPGHTIGGTSITVGSTSNWPTTTGAIFAMDTVSIVNGVEVRNINSYTEWEGVVTSGTDIGSLVLRYGTDQNYPAASTTRVYIPVASSRENRLVDGLSISLDQDGTLKANSVDGTTVLTDDIVTAAKMIYGMVRNRQGGTSGDNSWSDDGTNNTDTSAKNVFLQTGSIAVDANPKTVTFPTAYTQIPQVFLQVTTATSSRVFPIVITRLTTGFTCRTDSNTGVTVTTESVNWLAIGQ